MIEIPLVFDAIDDEIEGFLGKIDLSFRKYDARTCGRPKKRSVRLVYVCGIS